MREFPRVMRGNSQLELATLNHQTAVVLVDDAPEAWVIAKTVLDSAVELQDLPVANEMDYALAEDKLRLDATRHVDPGMWLALD
ncbi:hypothetical protein IAQ61_006974 [Plenodomus lingam]|uniref:uncharacterized protein n=1 Tax=Leptosphaeria maculans TaxID=5022 RepID=UPI0033186FEA|nr:hypothetical protein IAQ61_006974 [Plenodomus lingam]